MALPARAFENNEFKEPAEEITLYPPKATRMIFKNIFPDFYAVKIQSKPCLPNLNATLHAAAGRRFTSVPDLSASVVGFQEKGMSNLCLCSCWL